MFAYPGVLQFRSILLAMHPHLPWAGYRLMSLVPSSTAGLEPLLWCRASRFHHLHHLVFLGLRVARCSPDTCGGMFLQASSEDRRGLCRIARPYAQWGPRMGFCWSILGLHRVPLLAAYLAGLCATRRRAALWSAMRYAGG
eukprot:TRINITY_DN12459_c0_g1_i1.p3 TRINITY_DN12459_c0_g1~~TRINITY_DN12459_c0_g1_i1.p3  ORF type:complete len:141 (+),score=9.10 TRINITY_DN12459_c0_g1_i1:235-657(+)